MIKRKKKENEHHIFNDLWHIFVVIQPVIQFCNIFLKIYFDPCHTPVKPKLFGIILLACFRLCVIFLSPLVMTEIALVQNWFNWGRLKSCHFCKAIMKLYFLSYIFIFANLSKCLLIVTWYQPKFLNGTFRYWTVNLRGCTQICRSTPKKLHLCAARKSRTSSLPGHITAVGGETNLFVPSNL